MTSELLSKLISNQTNLSATSSNENENENPENQKILNPKLNLNLNADNCIPHIEIQKNIQSEFPLKSLKNGISSFISPSFSHYINPQRLIPYENMLIKNIRSFNLLDNVEKENEKKGDTSPKAKNMDTPTIEINFKFTCDYELIENDIKEFFELFGDINSLDYNMNANSAKINYKYSFSTMYANYYLNHLLYEKNEKENILINKEKNENKNEIINAENNIRTPEEKNEEIIKFIKFLTDNYKNESKNKDGENENESNKEKEKEKCIISIEKENKINDKNNSEIKYSSSLNKNKIINTEKKCYSNNNHSSKYLVLQQNSETPIKKTNTINNYSSNNINQNQNSNKKNETQLPQYNTYSTPFNHSLSTPMLYVPFVPKMNMGIPISIPVLFPMNSPFLNKSFYLNEKNENCENNIKKENNINSSLMNIPNDNPINIDSNIEKCEKDNNQNQNDNQIKEIFESLNNKIAIISNNSNNSTNSNEKNMKNVENNNEINKSCHRTNSEIGSNNNILSSKSDSTIKTDEVNKSSNSKSNNNSSEKGKDNKINDNNEHNNLGNNNSNNSSEKNSLNYDIISTSKGKAISLEKLNNYLENNKPMSSFANPKLSLSTEEKNNSSKKIEISNFNKNSGNTNNNNINKDNFCNTNKNNIPANFPKINIENKKNSFFPMPMNNFFNSMYNFVFLPNIHPNPKFLEILQKMKSQLPKLNNYNFKQNPIYFNKNVIDFNKLTLDTKNRVHFTTHSSRDYYYKYVCNYIVQIENDNLFMVTKRIIGKNGCFLKKILQESCIKYGDFSTKIRLRGKGSGYIDKISNTENEDEPLTLSVSSLNYPTYYNCCLLIDNLMNKIYDDYYKHLHNVLPKELHYSIHKKQLLKSEFIVDRVNAMYSNCENNNNNMNNKNNKNNNDNLKEEKKPENKDCEDKKGNC